MSRFGRVARRPDHWRSPHERARVRLAERMAGELGPDEAAWLDEHVTDCSPCASVATQYAADRLALRGLRDTPPQPPRDLWARTSAAIEQEAGNRHAAGGVAFLGGSRIPIGALSGIAVVALVIGVSTLSSSIVTPSPAGPGATNGQAAAPSDAAGGGPDGAQATPFAVGAGSVQWVDKTANGTLAFNNASVDEVCPTNGTSRCPALKLEAQQRLAVDSTPHTIIGSPTDGQAVMIADDGSGGDQLVLVDLPEPARTAAPSATPTPTEDAGRSLEPAATGSAEATTAPSSTPTPSDAMSSQEPTESPGTDTSGPTPPATAAIPSPSLSPEPTVAASLAIASDIELVGESAAFSASGSWFAFTARPADGSRGADVYVWRVGDEAARAITTDGGSVFASWDGDQIVASRPHSARLEGEAVSPASVRIDPATGEESPAGDVWRPVVDPTSRRAIGWSGSITRADDLATWAPDVGRLELLRWTDRGASDAEGGVTSAALVLADTAPAGFDVRWDERGEWVAVWVADAADPRVGRLTLYRVDGDGELEVADDAPTGVPALPGFSIGEGRLAWATPPGQDGEGSRIQIVAWGDDGVGSVESAPGEDLVVIR